MNQRVRAMMIALGLTVIAGCGGSDGGSSFFGPPTGSDACSLDGQKAFVLETMRDVYFWNDLLPANVDLSQYSTPEELLIDLTSVQPLDQFSFITSAQADDDLFSRGQFVGFGFSTTIVAADDVRFLRIIADSPANTAGLQRGQRLLAIDGVPVADIIAGEGLSEAFGPSEEGVTRTLSIRRLDGSEFDVVLTKAVATFDPVSQVQTFTINNVTYGYLSFSIFVGTANAQLESAFDSFRQQGITDVIVDMRYNGGGLVSVAENLGNLLGGEIANGNVFSRTLFNANNSGSNSTQLFSQLAQSINLSRLVVITTGGTASASELVINSMEPEASVQLVGSTTFGKPVGQVGIPFCDQILRPTAFETVNSLGDGQYFDGLPVDCAAEDDLNFAIGDQQEASLAAALTLLSTGSCPVTMSAPNARISEPREFRPPRARNSAERYGYVY